MIVRLSDGEKKRCEEVVETSWEQFLWKLNIIYDTWASMCNNLENAPLHYC